MRKTISSFSKKIAQAVEHMARRDMFTCLPSAFLYIISPNVLT